MKTPEHHLLCKDHLFEAEGGYGGLGVQCAALLLGAAAVFGASTKLSAAFRMGAMSHTQWVMLGGGATTGYLVGQQASINLMGNP